MDPECKWLVNAAIEKALKCLSQEIVDATSRAGSPLANALFAYKSKSASVLKSDHGPEADRLQTTTIKLDLLITSIVSKALLEGFAIDEKLVSFQLFSEFLFLIVSSHACNPHRIRWHHTFTIC